MKLEHFVVQKSRVQKKKKRWGYFKGAQELTEMSPSGQNWINWNKKKKQYCVLTGNAK